MLKAVSGGSGGAASGITIGTSVITSGTNTRVLFDDNGVVGESAGFTYTKASGLIAVTAVAVGGATIGTDALAWTGTATGSGRLSVGSLNVTGSTVPSNGFYLPTGNIIGFVASNSLQMKLSGGFLTSNTSGGFVIPMVAASSTVPVFIPNGAVDANTGIGSQASGNISFISGSVEQVRVVSTGLTIISGKKLTLGNAATTGLSAGVLAALTNATLVLTDSGGQDYRIPCII